MFAKFKSEKIIIPYRRHVLTVDGFVITNPTEDFILRAGYKPVICDEAPAIAQGEYLDVSYTDLGDSIRKSYTVRKIGEVCYEQDDV